VDHRKSGLGDYGIESTDITAEYIVLLYTDVRRSGTG